MLTHRAANRMVREGESLARALGAIRVFSLLTIHLVAGGELHDCACHTSAHYRNRSTGLLRANRALISTFVEAWTVSIKRNISRPVIAA